MIFDRIGNMTKEYDIKAGIEARVVWDYSSSASIPHHFRNDLVNEYMQG